MKAINPNPQEELMGNSNETRIIKRYQNRKLYDTSSSKYVTLNRLLDLVLSGIDFMVLDNKTKNDITSNILAKALFEYQSRNNKLPSVLDLRRAINNDLVGPIETVNVTATTVVEPNEVNTVVPAEVLATGNTNTVL